LASRVTDTPPTSTLARFTGGGATRAKARHSAPSARDSS
jgi:hypothetical protein